MDEIRDQEPENPEISSNEEEYELSHTDKLVGLFTEPGKTFSEMAKYPPKASDWAIPVIILIVLAILSNILMMSNPLIKQSIIEKQMEATEKVLQDQVDSGNMTQEQADAQLEGTRDFMENQMGGFVIIQYVATLVFIFIHFFIVTLVFFLIAKFLLKGDGTYQSSMVAFGMPYYIGVIGIVVMVILAMLMNKLFDGVSVAAFLDSDKTTIGGFLLSKVDIFSIWFYSIVSIAYAKMFKSGSSGIYFAMIYGMWLGFSILIFYLAKAVPFLANFAR